jgi:hypothetical protein
MESRMGYARVRCSLQCDLSNPRKLNKTQYAEAFCKLRRLAFLADVFVAHTYRAWDWVYGWLRLSQLLLSCVRYAIGFSVHATYTSGTVNSDLRSQCWGSLWRRSMWKAIRAVER